MKPQRVWYLGAADAEMAMIATFLMSAEETWRYAMDPRWHRVHPSTAYQWDAPVDATHLVECGRVCPPGAVRVDHHNPGDPGYGKGPARFWRASSIGQVLAVLGITVEWRQGEKGSTVYAFGPTKGHDALPKRMPGVAAERVLMIAAADHCLAAAYAERCPGVAPDRLRACRALMRAEWLASGTDPARDMPRREIAAIAGYSSAEEIDGGWGTPAAPSPGAIERWTAAVGAAYRYTAALLSDAPLISLGGVSIIDLRGVGTLPELPEVLALTGRGAVYRMAGPAGWSARIKIGVIGCGEGSVPGTAPVEAFLGGWAEAEGLVDIYPVHDGTADGIRAAAARGYAGGYLP